MKRESQEQLKKRALKIVSIVRKLFPEATTALRHENPLQLLIATILSAQCTDARVNVVTPFLFAKYRSANDFANADRVELEQEIRSTGFYRNKARNIIACCQEIVRKHSGKVPSTMEELLELPGVGRKTANCVLGGAYGIDSGVVVDTHVARLSQRLGLTKEKAPEKIEADLVKIIPKKYWYDFSNMLIFHGRETCTARKPNCPECKLHSLCPSAKKFTLQFWT
jgi:endonuclease-3